MASKNKCVLCGRIGVTLSIMGRPFTVCWRCAPALNRGLADFVGTIKKINVAAKPRSVKPVAKRAEEKAEEKKAERVSEEERPKKAISKEDLLERVLSSLEKRDQISIYDLARRLGSSRTNAKTVIEELSAKGYPIEKKGQRIYIKKPQKIQEAQEVQEAAPQA